MKLKMDNEILADEFLEGTRMLGIVAPVKDYQFCWYVNQILQVDFRINNDLEIQLSKKKRDYFFSIYEYKVPNSSLEYFLYNNQFDGEYLLPEFKHLDFLWLLKGDEVDPEQLAVLQQSVKIIPSVQLVMELSTEKIKNRGNLIL
jgi:hypothetical protein